MQLQKETPDPHTTIICNGLDEIKVSISYETFIKTCERFYWDWIGLASANMYSGDDTVIDRNVMRVFSVTQMLYQFGIRLSNEDLPYYTLDSRTFPEIQLVCKNKSDYYSISYDYANRKIIKSGHINGYDFHLEEKMPDYLTISPRHVLYENRQSIW